MSLSQLFGDPLMLFKALFGFLWTDDIVNVRLVCKGFNDVVETFKETLKKDVWYGILIEDYEGYFEKVKKALESKKSCKFGWNWINISMKWSEFDKELVSHKDDLTICFKDTYNIYLIYGYKDEIFNGKSIGWWNNGRKYSKCFYKDGRPEGKCVVWHPSGAIHEECFYKDGMADGKFIRYYETGVKEIECFYKEGEPVGEYRSWNKDGTEAVKRFYKNSTYAVLKD